MKKPKRATNTAVTKRPTQHEKIAFVHRKANDKLKRIAREADTSVTHKRRT